MFIIFVKKPKFFQIAVFLPATDMDLIVSFRHLNAQYT